MKIGIIGAGKVGTCIAFTLKSKGFDIRYMSSRSDESIERAKNYLGRGTILTKDNREVVRHTDVIAITTQDSVIKDVARELGNFFANLEGKIFFHTSGAHPSFILSPLKERGGLIGSLHPLQTFPDIDRAIKTIGKAFIFIEGDERAKEILRKIGNNLGRKVYEIGSEKKVLYHLSAVFLCNLLCALLFGGERILKDIGLDIKPFMPLIETTIKNVKKKGTLASLTGPIVRGDIETIVSHLEAIKGMKLERDAYKNLSLLALEIVKQKKVLDEKRTKDIEVILK